LNWPGFGAARLRSSFGVVNIAFFSEYFVAYRPPSTRVAWLPLVAMSCATLGSVLFVGCQSNAQYDQVARELRMQEDELYALEDYLDQYQKLVCKYRAENAALKRQLADDGVTSSMPRPENGARPAPAGPKIEVPAPKNGAPRPPDVDAPDIPPLEETAPGDSASNTRSRKSRGRAKLSGGTITDGMVTRAQAIAFEPFEREQTVKEVWLHGEVVANATGGGPRILVRIQPLDAKGRAIAFQGPLSLMLMAPAEGGVRVPVARWDYRPQDVRAAVQAATDGDTIQFNLELPADTPISKDTQIWVRLLQRGGAKLLEHADIKLEEPGLFSSRSTDGREDAAPAGSGRGAAPMAATADEHGATTAQTGQAAIGSEMIDGGWTIARPGRPAGMAKDGEANNSDWRASLEPPPSITVRSPAAKPKPRVSRPREPRSSGNLTKTKTPKSATWMPDRSADAPTGVRTATRPTWSATR